MRRRERPLTPLEIQSKWGGGNADATEMERNGTPAKIIRFYGDMKPEKPMDFLTIEDLKEAGFVPFRYVDQVSLKQMEDPAKLVHGSVPVATSKVATESKEYEHPVIRHELGYGWEAKWGAVRFPLRSEIELWRFMKQFGYPLPIDKKPE